MNQLTDSSSNVAAGRKDSSGQESVIKMESLITRLPDLIAQHNALEEVKKDFSEAIRIVAEATGLHADTVKKVVRSKAGENFYEIHGKVRQMALAFEEIEQCAGVQI